MKIIYYLTIGLMLITITNGLEYTGNNELYIRDIYGNETYLDSGDNLSLDSSLTYYFILNPATHAKNLRSAVDYLLLIFNGLLFGIILIVGTFIIIKLII